jgi:drug/metabolite transporter (DMT)-like permease
MIRLYSELLFATMVWGFGFIASIWALRGMGPVLNTALRFGIAFIFLDLICRFRLFKTTPIRYNRKDFLKIMKPGILLFAMMVFQTWGLKYTGPARSGFITVLYVVFVPLFERFFIGTKIRALIILWITMALIGTALICGVVTTNGVNHEFLGAINRGDVYTFMCAIFGAAHIIAVNQTLHEIESPIQFQVYQCLWITLLATVLTAFTEGFSALFSPWDLLTWVGLLHLGILSSAIAFLIQIRAQKTIPPASFGLLVLLESPWALVFSFLLGMEILISFQLVGAGLILAAATFESLTSASNQNTVVSNERHRREFY